MDAAPFAGREPWMLGDDLTDEHAFAEVDARDGTSIIVGARRPTLARHALAGPAAVHAWLAALVRP
jgi:trehalose 6-phosphate phosphatase